jgi:hypothetical protein
VSVREENCDKKSINQMGRKSLKSENEAAAQGKKRREREQIVITIL